MARRDVGPFAAAGRLDARCARGARAEVELDGDVVQGAGARYERQFECSCVCVWMDGWMSGREGRGG